LETAKVKTKKYTYFIGIDVSKNTLDYAVMHQSKLLFHRQGKNQPADIRSFITELKKLNKFRLATALFCAEYTGLYCNHLYSVFEKLNTSLAVEHPLHLKRSLGLIRLKSDKSDAIQIATYAQKNAGGLRLWAPRRPVIEELANLVTFRNRLLAVSVALNTPVDEQSAFVKKQVQQQSLGLCKRSLSALKSDLSAIGLRVESLINMDERLKRLHQLIASVPGVGTVTAVQVILSTNEFRHIDHPKKFASYAGVAPFRKESGQMFRKARVSNQANRRMKSLLHLCALSAIRYDAEMKTYYEKKHNTEGKPKLAVINAVRYKLIRRIFACVKGDRVFVKKDESEEEVNGQHVVV